MGVLGGGGANVSDGRGVVARVFGDVQDVEEGEEEGRAWEDVRGVLMYN